MSLLQIDKLNTFYGDSHVLFDVSMTVERSEVVALLGRNGAGKTTTLESIAGALKPRSGSVRLGDEEVCGRPAFEVARRGLQLVPEERRIFGALTVEENLKLAAFSVSDAEPISKIYEMFPRLEERRRSGGKMLSGGEQQMLAIARALIRKPDIILLDEPFEGLAPVIVQNLMAVCERIAADGQTIVVVEQNVYAALKFSHRAYILNNGHVVYEGTPDDLKQKPEILHQYLGV